MTTGDQQDVVILCGGLGTRLRAVVADRPKPMALIEGRPFLDWVVDHVASQGFRRVIFSTGHQGDWISNHIKTRRDIEAIIAQEDQPLGTGGALRACRPFLTTATTLVLNGDSLCRLDLHALLAAHHVQSAVATLAVVASHGRRDAGGVRLDERGRILIFREKEPGPYMNAGIYAISTAYLPRIPAETPCSLEREVFPVLAGKGLYGFVCEAPLYDIGTPERLANFQALQRGHCQEACVKGTA